jgi:pyruvate dehydrogenase E1 component alpha subunit
MPGVTVDGNDLDAVHAAAVAAVARARAGEGPTLIEAVTYRWKGHSKSDKNLYRTREEIAEWRGRDPIAALEARVLAGGVLADAEIAAVREEATAQVKAAVREASAGPDADPRDLLDGVYAAVDPQAARNEVAR